MSEMNDGEFVIDESGPTVARLEAHDAMYLAAYLKIQAGGIETSIEMDPQKVREFALHMTDLADAIDHYMEHRKWPDQPVINPKAGTT